MYSVVTSKIHIALIIQSSEKSLDKLTSIRQSPVPTQSRRTFFN